MASKKTQRKHHHRDTATGFADDWKKFKEDTIQDIIGLVSTLNEEKEGKAKEESKSEGENGKLRRKVSEQKEVKPQESRKTIDPRKNSDSVTTLESDEPKQNTERHCTTAKVTPQNDGKNDNTPDTTDYLIEDLFADIGKIGNERDEFKAKYENALTQIEIANEKIQHLENEGKENEGKGFREEIQDFRTYDEIVAENDHLGRRVVDLLALVAEMENEKKEAKEISDLDEDWICTLIAERDEQCESKKRYMEQIEAYKKKIKELEDKRNAAIAESGIAMVLDNAQTIGSDPVVAAFMHKDEETKEQNDSITEKHDVTGSTNSTLCIDLADSGIDLSSLTKLIDDRVEENLRKRCEPQCTKNEEEIVTSFYAQTSRFTDQTNTTRNSEEKRAQNIIIHGINEGKNADAQILAKFFDVLGLDSNGMRSSHRLGMKQNERKRPLKIIMKSFEEKEKVMSRLGRLRGADGELKRISVTDDYTLEEREEIKRWVTMAKERNMNETTNEWKVRGTPNTGMRLTRVQC